MARDGQDEQGQKRTRHKRPRRRGPSREPTFPRTTEELQHIATILGVVIALATGLWTAYTFIQSSYVQAEDAAYRVLHEHFSLRLEGIKELDDPGLMDLIEEHPKILKDKILKDSERVSDKDLAIYTSVAGHGVSIAEQIYRTRGDEEYWRSAAGSLIWKYRALIIYVKLRCGTFNPEFIEFISETLQISRTSFCPEERSQPWTQPWERKLFGGGQGSWEE
jgi:hypothetical protein